MTAPNNALADLRFRWFALRLVTLAGFLVLLTARVAAQSVSPKALFGAQVKLSVAREHLTGELLAVSNDSIWLMHDRQIVAIARADVHSVKYRRHNFTPRRALVAGGVVTTATTVAFGAACAQYQSTTEGSGILCGNAVGGWFAISASLTGITALWTAWRSWTVFPLVNWERLSAYARFPQGIPASMRA
ncbi:MAG: hypothetical protein IT353_16925 [Gemmatimonadaceae bacterium]|nr:hypothetical protein [Gemmatimonadaceae bacterium]